MMNIYLIEATWHVQYDNHEGFVVVAESEAQVIEMILDWMGIEERASIDMWMDKATMEIVGTSPSTTPGVVLASYHHG